MSKPQTIADRTIGNYLAALGSSQPTPGGGSVSGLVGALAAGLGLMVVSLTLKGAAGESDLAGADGQLRVIAEELLAASETDELAYGGYLDASRLPRSTEAEKSTRRAAIQAALINATETPLGMAMTACELLDCLEPVVTLGSSHALSDAEIAISLAHVSVKAALVNARINVPLIKNAQIATDLVERADGIDARADMRVGALRTDLRERRG